MNCRLIAVGNRRAMTMILRAMLVTAVGLAVQVACSTAHASEAYCHDFAQGWYQQAVALGSETPDGVYEQAQADCELQESALTDLSYSQAIALADLEGRYGVVALGGDRWRPTTQAEDAAADAQGVGGIVRVGANRYLPVAR